MFDIKIKGLDRLNRAVQKSPQIVFDELSKAIKTSVNLIRPIMRKEVPRGATRRLSANIQAKSSGLKGSVGPNLDITPYAIFVHEGTSPYTIRPKAKKALWWPGARHPVRSVRHPGIKANRFVERAFGQIKKPVEQIFEKTVDVIIRRIHKG